MANHYDIPFAKLHGLSNDFIVVHGRGLPNKLPALARAITESHTGVGADGLLVLLPPRNKQHDARIRIFNADGSEPEMSGNGIRCAAAFLLAERSSKRKLAIETAAGRKTLRLIKSERGRWIFQVGMGAPILGPRDIPFRSGNFETPVVGFPLPVRGRRVRVTVTSMGNPHCTVFVKDFVHTDWKNLGREIECHKLFPNHTNVEFARVRSRKHIEVRYWERGVGETMSSGTGSCGATVASILNGFTERKVTVQAPAGKLQVEWPEHGEVLLTGPVEWIARGTYLFRSTR
jgi:diaminopimelate epimerase